MKKSPTSTVAMLPPMTRLSIRTGGVGVVPLEYSYSAAASTRSGTAGHGAYPCGPHAIVDPPGHVIVALKQTHSVPLNARGCTHSASFAAESSSTTHASCPGANMYPESHAVGRHGPKPVVESKHLEAPSPLSTTHGRAGSCVEQSPQDASGAGAVTPRTTRA